ncbi:MAG: hypothetical protein ACJ757_01345 [Gaiellaceae bacterium]
MTLTSTPLPACWRSSSRIASVGLAEDLNAHRRVERFRVRLHRALANDLHVGLHRRSVWVDLHDGHLIAGFVGVLVERDQSWFVGLDELNEARHAFPLALERPRLETVRGDEDERRRHCGSF